MRENCKRTNTRRGEKILYEKPSGGARSLRRSSQSRHLSAAYSTNVLCHVWADGVSNADSTPVHLTMNVHQTGTRSDGMGDRTKDRGRNATTIKNWNETGVVIRFFDKWER